MNLKSFTILSCAALMTAAVWADTSAGFNVDWRGLPNVQGILKDKEFEIFVLHVMNEMSFQEIAEWKKRPLGTILWSYSNSLKKIRKEIPYETV